MEGDSMLDWPNGLKFEGIFIQGKKNGNGKLTLPNKAIINGKW